VSRICVADDGQDSGSDGAKSGRGTDCYDEVGDHRWIVGEEEIENSRDDCHFVEIVTEQGQSPREGEEGHRRCLVDERVHPWIDPLNQTVCEPDPLKIEKSAVAKRFRRGRLT
jgi:hypothetical protein